MKIGDDERDLEATYLVEELLAQPAGPFGDADLDVGPVLVHRERVHGECALGVDGVCDGFVGAVAEG